MNKIRMGMVGGGKQSFIGQVHRSAAAIDGLYELVCGCFSQDEHRNQDSGESLGLPNNRIYSQFQQMMEAEAKLPESERMQLVVIVTPNHLHWPVAKCALENGFHIMSDKPATISLAECQALQSLLNKTGLLYGLTHVYTGYPLVKEARQRVTDGQLGKIRKVVVEYSQGWLFNQSCETGKQALWRLDPKQSGPSCCIGDIGTHAANLTEYITGLTISKICVDLDTVVEGRNVDDDGNILFKLSNSAKGVMIVSQVATGDENDLNIKIYGDKGSIKWAQQEPNCLQLKISGEPLQILKPGNPYLSAAATSNTRIPSGHPEGFIEAFANIYKNFAEDLSCYINKTKSNSKIDYPNIIDALRGMAFIEAVLASTKTEDKWYSIPEV